MPGITSFGAYIPSYRLNRELMARAWGQQHLRGERAVANFDEDSVTMAQEASANCLCGIDPRQVAGLYFASVSAPYIEKQASSLVATACRLPRHLATADFAGSARASTAALKLALQASVAEPGKQILVCAADVRSAQPGSDLEQYQGDAAAALLVGGEDPVAIVEDSYSVSEEILDTWRRDDDPFPQRGDVAFIQSYGYQRLVKECVAGLLQRNQRKPGDVAFLILNAPDPRGPSIVAKALDFADAQLGDPLLGSVGDAGNASALLLLAASLERARPGDRLLLCNYSAGSADAFLLLVTEAIQKRRSSRGVAHYLQQRRPLDNYTKLLTFRRVLRTDDVHPFSSSTEAWRDTKQNLQLLGQKCRDCARVLYPRGHVCPGCGSRDNFEDIRMGPRGTLFTFTKDHLFPSPDPPTIMGVADLEGGARFYGQLADCDPTAVRIGMGVETVLRRLHEGGGFINYFWKLRPTGEEARGTGANDEHQG